MDIQERETSYATALRAATGELSPVWKILDWQQKNVSWRSYHRSDANLPYQGWKLHVSAAAVEAEAFCSAVVPILIRLGVSFKIARRIQDYVVINSGDAGSTQLGKIVTVYPSDDEQAVRIAREIHRAWPVSLGPEVLTDLHLEPGSAVSMRFGVFGKGEPVIGPSGRYEACLREGNGISVPDFRSVVGEQSTLAPVLPLPLFPPRLSPVAVNEQLEFDARHYVTLAILRDSPKGRVFLGTRLDSLETVIIKVAHRGVAGDFWGDDAATRLKKEFAILSDLSRRAGLAPKPLQWIDGHGPISIVSDVRGELLSELGFAERIKCLPLLAKAVESLHEAGYIHGDLKLDNAIRTEDGVCLIDFELTQAVGIRIGRAGTMGYLAPESRIEMAAAPARDTYALGCCVAEAVLGFPLGLLNTNIDCLVKLLQLDSLAAASLVRKLCAIDPQARPNAVQARALIEEALPYLLNDELPPSQSTSETDRSWACRIAVEAGRAARSYAVPQREGHCWRNEHFMSSFHGEGINLGAAGIILGLGTIDCATDGFNFSDDIDAGAKWLASQSPSGKSAGLFTGNAGVALALAVTGKLFRNNRYLAAARSRLEHAADDERGCDLFSGSAGVLWASCLIGKIIEEDWPLDLGAKVATTLSHRHCHRDGMSYWLVNAETNDRYHGCAHGSAGVALALSSWGAITGDSRAQEMALTTFKELYHQGRTADGASMVVAQHSAARHAVGNWCHGVAGYLWAILQGPGDHPALAQEIDWAVRALLKEKTIGTCTYCHGLAGQLELWRMLQEIPRWREIASDRAERAAATLRVLHEQKDGLGIWRSDDPMIITPDLWIGFLGPATALAMHAVGAKGAMLSARWLARCAEDRRAMHDPLAASDVEGRDPVHRP